MQTYGCLGTGIQESGKTARMLIVAPVAILATIAIAVVAVKLAKGDKKFEAPDEIRCTHCNAIITNEEKMWSRGRRHWCSKTCYEESKGSKFEAPKPKDEEPDWSDWELNINNLLDEIDASLEFNDGYMEVVSDDGETLFKTKKTSGWQQRVDNFVWKHHTVDAAGNVKYKTPESPTHFKTESKGSKFEAGLDRTPPDVDVSHPLSSYEMKQLEQAFREHLDGGKEKSPIDKWDIVRYWRGYMDALIDANIISYKAGMQIWDISGTYLEYKTVWAELHTTQHERGFERFSSQGTRRRLNG